MNCSNDTECYTIAYYNREQFWQYSLLLLTKSQSSDVDKWSSRGDYHSDREVNVLLRISRIDQK